MKFKFGSKVVNKLNEEGVLLKEEEGRLIADFSGKIMKFPSNAFEMGFLSYLDSSSQDEVLLAKEEAETKEKERLKKIEEADLAAKEKAKETPDSPAKKSKGGKSLAKVVYSGKDESSKHNVILLKRHNRSLKFDNPFYLNQCSCLQDYIVLEVTSRCVGNKDFMKEHPSFAKDLSPFYAGPVTSSDGKTCQIFELFWQCSKVFPGFDDHGTPNENYFKWRDGYYPLTEVKDHNELRRPWAKLGFKANDTLYEAYYDKEEKKWVKLSYIESRKKIYFVEYAKLVYNSPSFRWIKSLLEEGKKVALVDFDAFNFYSDQAKTKAYESYATKCKSNHVNPSLTLNDFLNVKTMKDVVNFALPAGHGVVLKALLDGDLEVDAAGNVIDHAGILA